MSTKLPGALVTPLKKYSTPPGSRDFSEISGFPLSETL